MKEKFSSSLISVLTYIYKWIISPFKYDRNGVLIEYRGWGGDIVIPKDVTIGKNAFQDCKGITQLIISDGVTIGEGAFWGCTGITQLTIPEGVTISNDAFQNCTGITQLIISEDVTIGAAVFQGCTGITHLTISEGVTIGNGAFQDCTGITQLTIPEGVTIDEGAFQDCIGIAEIIIHKNVTIADWAFWRCAGITQLTIPEDVTVGFYAFRSCTGITQFIISEGATIDNNAFQDCTGIAKTYVSCRLGELAKKEGVEREIKDINQVDASAKEIGTVVREMPMYQRLVNFRKPVGLAILHNKSYINLEAFLSFLGKREKERIKTLTLCLYRLSVKGKVPELPLLDLLPVIIKPSITSIRYYETEEPVKVESGAVLECFSNI